MAGGGEEKEVEGGDGWRRRGERGVMPGSQACQIKESHTGFNAKQYAFI